MWEKEKLLVTSNFSFSHMFSTQSDDFIPHLSVFFDVISLFAAELTEPKIDISGKGLNMKILFWCISLLSYLHHFEKNLA